MSVHESPEGTTTPSGVTSPPPLDLDAVRRARQHVEDQGRAFWVADLRALLSAYDNLAARYAFAVASLADIEREVSRVVQQDTHSDRLLLGEIRMMHKSDPQGNCAECGTVHPCDTRLLIEGKA